MWDRPGNASERGAVAWYFVASLVVLLGTCVLAYWGTRAADIRTVTLNSPTFAQLTTEESTRWSAKYAGSTRSTIEREFHEHRADCDLLAEQLFANCFEQGVYATTAITESGASFLTHIPRPFVRSMVRTLDGKQVLCVVTLSPTIAPELWDLYKETVWLEAAVVAASPSQTGNP